MKNFFNKHISVLSAGVIVLFTACSDGDKVFDEIVDGETRGSILRTIETRQNTIDYDVPTSTLTSGGFDVTVEVQDQEGGDLLEALEVYIGYNDKTSDIGNSTIGDGEVLIQTFSPSDGTIGEFGLPQFDFAISALEMQSALGLTGDDIFGGDDFTIRFEIVRTDGVRYSAANNSGTITGSFFSSPFEYASTLVCAPKPPGAGTWTVEMQDAYGDGWQPTTSDGGGPGLTITLSDGTVFELGLCTPYEDPGYACTDGTSSGTATFEVPPGMTAASEIMFNGDFWGEISFQIITPSGNTVADIGTGTDAGLVAIDYCAD